MTSPAFLQRLRLQATILFIALRMQRTRRSGARSACAAEKQRGRQVHDEELSDDSARRDRALLRGEEWHLGNGRLIDDLDNERMDRVAVGVARSVHAGGFLVGEML